VTRWPLLLFTLALAAAAIAVISRRATEPDRRRHVPTDKFDEIAAEPAPEMMMLRPFAKRRIAREAAAGTRPLLHAAALFRELNLQPPVVAGPNHPSLPGRTEDERFCWQVIAYVAEPEDDWPAPVAAAAAAWLEEGLREELHRHGTVRLPDRADLPPVLQVLEQVRATMTEAERRAWLPARRGGPQRR